MRPDAMILVFWMLSFKDARVGLWRKLSAEELMLLHCGVGEDSWESLRLQGDPTSPSYSKSTLNIHCKDWCWSWNSNSLATWCEELTHLKRWVSSYLGNAHLVLEGHFLCHRQKYNVEEHKLLLLQVLIISSLLESADITFSTQGWDPLQAFHIPLTWFSSVQSVSLVRVFVTPWTAACRASLSSTNSQLNFETAQTHDDQVGDAI